MNIQVHFIKKILKLSSILFFFSYLILISCSSDFDFHRKKRLNNGNYLVMTTKGIYFFNEAFTANISLISFGSRLISENYELYMSDIEQFSSGDNGYIICLLKSETYFLSKNGVLLKQMTLDYILNNYYFNIIPLGKFNNQNKFYYVIINMENKKTIVFRKYYFDSSDNNIYFSQKYEYNVTNCEQHGITCELMNYLDNNKVITCFYGTWSRTSYTVFNINDFSLLSEIIQEKYQLNMELMVGKYLYQLLFLQKEKKPFVVLNMIRIMDVLNII